MATLLCKPYWQTIPFYKSFWLICQIIKSKTFKFHNTFISYRENKVITKKGWPNRCWRSRQHIFLLKNKEQGNWNRNPDCLLVSFVHVTSLFCLVYLGIPFRQYLVLSAFCKCCIKKKSWLSHSLIQCIPVCQCITILLFKTMQNLLPFWSSKLNE